MNILSSVNGNLALKEPAYSLQKFARILGNSYTITISYSNIKFPALNFENNYISILLPNKFKNTNNTELIETILDKMYLSIAQNEIEYIMEKIRILLGFAPEDFEIKKINKLSKFSDENKSITINPRIVMYKKPVIEFILLHQFCHIKYKTHSQKFNELMKEHCSHYETLLKKTHGLNF